jgi:uncharacterized protein involved in response to NO
MLESGLHWGVYGGLYLVIGLVLTMGRRVIPFFIERGVGYPVTLFNSKWIDMSSLVLFLALFIVELFIADKSLVPWLAGALFAVNAVRLAGWHTPGIWKKPLLWSLYVAYAFIVAGLPAARIEWFHRRVPVRRHPRLRLRRYRPDHAEHDGPRFPRSYRTRHSRPPAPRPGRCWR